MLNNYIYTIYLKVFNETINYVIIKLDDNTIESMFALFTSTIIYFYIFKFIENEKKSELNKIDTKSRIYISLIYGLLSLSIKYIYNIFINTDSIYTFEPIIKLNYI